MAIITLPKVFCFTCFPHELIVGHEDLGVRICKAALQLSLLDRLYIQKTLLFTNPSTPMILIVLMYCTIFVKISKIFYAYLFILYKTSHILSESQQNSFQQFLRILMDTK